MGINSTEVAYGFGQLGSGYLDDTGALTPPTGKVIVAIQVILGIFTLLSDLNIIIAAAHQISSVILILGSLKLYHLSIK